MRYATMVLISLVLAAGSAAEAAMCSDCKKGGPYTKDIGECSVCKDRCTTSGEHKLCTACSTKLQQCEHCAKAMKAPATQPTTRPIDTRDDGAYTEGDWEYRYQVSLKGSRSEGYHGQLLYKGKPVADPETINDFYQTPWGPIYWVGKPVTLFGGHGWMTKPKVSEKVGKQLPDPAAAKP